MSGSLDVALSYHRCSAMLKAKPEDEKPKAVIRPYTPTSPPDAKGYLDLVVKVYDKVHSRVVTSSKQPAACRDHFPQLPLPGLTCVCMCVCVNYTVVC